MNILTLKELKSSLGQTNITEPTLVMDETGVFLYVIYPYKKYINESTLMHKFSSELLECSLLEANILNKNK